MRILRTILIAVVAALALGGLWLSTRPGMDVVGIPYATTEQIPQGLRVHWLGVATLLFDDGETQIMTDGFVSRPTLLDLALRRPIAADVGAIEAAIEDHQINRLAAIMPVHSHYDHALDTADFARLTGADILGSSSTSNIARSSVVDPSQIRIIETGVPYSYGNFNVTFFDSKHAPLSTNSGIEGAVDAPFKLPAPYTAWKEGQSYTLLIEHPQASVVIQGSAGFIPGVLQDVQADAVFLGVGGLIDLSADYRQQYVDEIVHAVNPEQVFIIHHDDLFGDFGGVEQNKIVLSFDKTFAHQLTQLVLPASLLQMPFGTAVPLAGTKE